LDEAEELVISLETNGARLNHPWMSAVGGRCRSMLLASRGELEAAERAAVAAVADLAALPAPFECARTQLVLGQVRRRLRRRQAARLVLEEALRTFEGLGTPIWVERAAVELARVTLLKGRESDLTPAELRVAELAATGMTNKAVAAALFISPKTVECNLGRVYRKLGIRGRVELRRSLNADGLGSADA
ncbi:MAG: helix-turn-helix transcriptional regulator, partial [Actinomycetota bacterium]|nr:helix-turn-helix transcriptional regulator [Actinomycetota bacterium]